MHEVKGFLCLVLALCLIFALAAPCFASPATLTGIDFFSAAFQTFLEICGLTTVLTSNGVASDSSDPYSQVQLTDQYQSLFDEYQSSVSSSDTISDWYSTYSNSISVVPDQTHSVFSPTIDAALSDWFSRFTGWILEDKYNCVPTESGFVHSAGSFDSPLSSVDIVAINGVNILPLSVGTVIGSHPYGSVFIGSLSSTSPVYAYRTGSDSNTKRVVFVSNSPFSVTYMLGGNSEFLTASSLSSSYYFSYGVYRIPFGNDYVSSVPYVGSVGNNEYYPSSGYITSDSTDSIQLRPKDKYNEQVIPVPNVEDAGYFAGSLTGDYSDAITGALTGIQNPTLDEILQSVLDVTLANTEVIADESVDPVPPDLTPVEIPFLGFTLPSFNLGLSSIWHYVIDWVGSLGSGISFIGSVWSNLPYAMVIPIYATAVVVIVLGMFKRFLL